MVNLKTNSAGQKIELKKPKEIPSDSLNLITHVDVEAACKSDANALIPAMESIKSCNLSPKEIQADPLYGSDENHQAAKSVGFDLVSPTMGSTKQEGLNLSDFELLENGQVELCPQGYSPVVRKFRGIKAVRFTAVLKTIGVTIFRATAILKAACRV